MLAKRRSRTPLILVFVTLLAGGIAGCSDQQASERPRNMRLVILEPPSSPGLPPDAYAGGNPPRSGTRMRPCTFDVDGIDQPRSIQASAAGIPDDRLVIGVRVGMVTRAYLLRAFQIREQGLRLRVRPDGTVKPDERQAALLARHVVNDVIGDQAITITHCDRQQCTRVLTQPGQSAPLDIGIAGWNDGMLLTVNGERIPQRSDEMPLEDLPFEVTTWKEWRDRHPETDVYVGG